MSKEKSLRQNHFHHLVTTLNAKEKRHLAYKKKRAKELLELGKPANLEQSRRFKNENPGANRKNWKNWSSETENKLFRRKYHQVRADAKRNGYNAYFPKRVWVQWVEAGADENSYLLLLDTKDFPPLKRSYN